MIHKTGLVFKIVITSLLLSILYASPARRRPGSRLEKDRRCRKSRKMQPAVLGISFFAVIKKDLSALKSGSICHKRQLQRYILRAKIARDQDRLLRALSQISDHVVAAVFHGHEVAVNKSIFISRVLAQCDQLLVERQDGILPPQLLLHVDLCNWDSP